jgi:hypothetical protein
MDFFDGNLFNRLNGSPLPKKHLEARDYLILLQAYISHRS